MEIILTPQLLEHLHALWLQVGGDISELPQWVSTITDLGLTGSLVLAVWALVTGRVLPASVVERQMQYVNELAKVSLTREFQDAIQDSVKRGFIEAWVELEKHREDTRARKTD